MLQLNIQSVCSVQTSQKENILNANIKTCKTVKGIENFTTSEHNDKTNQSGNHSSNLSNCSTRNVLTPECVISDMFLKYMMGDAENEAIIDKIFANINGSHPDCQLAVAAMTGYIYGVIMTKIGKTLALATGGGIILLQLANNHGIITIHYNKISIPRNAAYMRNSVGDSFCHAIDSIYSFAKTNSIFTIGFIGGMLVGVGSCL